MKLEEFGVNVQVEGAEPYLETNPCTVLGNLRGELKPGRTYVMTWAGGEPVEEELMQKLVDRWGLLDDYLSVVAKAQEKQRKIERQNNPQASEKPEI